MPDKYEYVRTLGRGMDNTTYLVRHKQLGSYLALKTVSDRRNSPAQLYREINLIKKLNHPSIPKVIDIIKEEQLFVVQEYIPGISLEEYLSKKISIEQFLSISGQLASVIYYLHNFEKEPILYLDFKPEHIKVYENQVFLLDYGMAKSCKKGVVKNVFYGTEEYSAPEVKKDHCATVSADIYSLGKILEGIMKQIETRNYGDKTRLLRIQKILCKCVQEEEELRYETVEEVLFELQQVQRRRQKILSIKEPHLRITVAVIGTHHHVGTTHIATGLTHCYNQSGIRGIYVESSKKQWLRQSSVGKTSEWGVIREVSDYVKKGNFLGLPAYGPYYEPIMEESGIYIRDLGVIWEGFSTESYDKVVLVLGNRFWEEEETLKQIQRFKNKRNCIFVCSAASTYRVKELVKLSGVPIYSWSYDEDVFHISKEKIKILNRLLRKELYA